MLFKFLNNLPPAETVTIGNKKYFFFHAGIEVDTPLEKQRPNQLVGHYGYENFYKNYSGDALIVVGHKSPMKILKKFPELFKDDTDTTKPLKIPDKNILMLDTRAKDDDNGLLSCVDVLSGRYWQSSL